MTGNRALLTNFMEKFLGTVCFGNNDFAVIAGYGDVVIGLPKMKFEKDHLCSACEQGKIHQKHHKSKMAFASNKPLYLLHMDLCGPMRRVQTDDGMEFKNKTLAKFFDEDVGKLKVKGDIGVFVGYSKESDAFRIYNKRTCKIQESVNIMKSTTTNVETSIKEEVFHELIPINMIPNGDEASSSHNVFNELLDNAYFDASTSFH
nr:hypothetical protein [Tanacetum cinerariifolium]